MSSDKSIVLLTELAALAPGVAYAAIGVWPNSVGLRSAIGPLRVFGTSKYPFVQALAPQKSIDFYIDAASGKRFTRETGGPILLRNRHSDPIHNTLLQYSESGFLMYSNRVLDDSPPVFAAEGCEIHPSIHDVTFHLCVQCLADLPDTQRAFLADEVLLAKSAESIAEFNRRFPPKSVTDMEAMRMRENPGAVMLRELRRRAQETALAPGQWLPFILEANGISVPGAATIQSMDASGTCHARLHLTEDVDQIREGTVLRRQLEWRHDGRLDEWRKDIAVIITSRKLER